MNINTTKRISPLMPPFSESVQSDFDAVMPKGMAPLGIFRTVAHNPRVLHRMVVGGLLDKGSISINEREMVILRTCALCKAEYEWGVHASGFAKVAGLTHEQVEDTVQRNVDEKIWTDEQKLVLKLSDQLHFSHGVDQNLWEELEKSYTNEQVIELVMLAGLYHAVSYVVNACGVENETFARTFPAKGSLTLS